MPSKSADRIRIALAHHRAGSLSQAEAIYRQILSDDPNHAETLNRMGVIAMQTGRHEAAAKFLSRAIAINPDSADYHNNLGEALRRSGRYAESLQSLAHAIELNPKLAVAYNNRGLTLAETNRIAEAIESYQHAVKLKTDYDEAYNNMGVALAALDRFDDAIAAYNRAIQLNPNFSEALSNRGNALAAVGKADEAVASCEAAVQIIPDSVQAHWNLAVILLRSGDFQRGFHEYEWRWKGPARTRAFPQPRWTGQDLAGKTILLHAEQGFGDTIQFVRYVPLVSARGAQIILECQPQLARLFSSLKGVDQIIEQGQPLPVCDFHCPLMSLPLIFQTRLKTIPAGVPYLFPDDVDVEKWRKRIAPEPRTLNVGLAWAGKQTHNNDRKRSITFEHFAQLAHPLIHFHSLQKDRAPLQVPPQMHWQDNSPQLTDFAETAALISNLDLIVSVDTSVAHLAAALGKPVFLLLPSLPDWRWLSNRSDSPWYPTMRLFRQSRPDDWATPMQEVRRALDSYFS